MKKPVVLLGVQSITCFTPYVFLVREEKHKVIIAKSELELLRKAMINSPDLILVNHKPPVLDGVRCCKRLHQLRGIKDIPVVILGDAENKGLVIRALKAGAADFLARAGVEFDTFMSRIERLLQISSKGENADVADGADPLITQVKAEAHGSERSISHTGSTKGSESVAGIGPDKVDDIGKGITKSTARARRRVRVGNQLVSRSRIEKKLNEVCDIKAMPNIVNEILATLSNEEAGVKEVVEIIDREQAVAVKILKYANSSLFSIRTRTDSLKHAVVRIGFRRVSEIVMGLAVLDVMLRNTDEDSKLDRHALWEHSMGCAALANRIAQDVGFKPAEHALLAGLLHDLGKAILEEALPEEYGMVLEKAEKNGERLYIMEKKLLHMDHAEVGARVLRSWGLPQCFIDPVLLHHESWHKVKRMLNRDRKLVAIVKIADTMAKAVFPSWGGDDYFHKLSDEMFGFIGVDRDMMSGVVDGSSYAVSELRKIMGVQGDDEDTRYHDDKFKGAKVLVVTDNKFHLSLPALFLGAKGMEIRVADGPGMDTVISSWEPDIIVIDDESERLCRYIMENHPDGKVLLVDSDGNIPLCPPDWNIITGQPSGRAMEGALELLLGQPAVNNEKS